MQWHRGPKARNSSRTTKAPAVLDETSGKARVVHMVREVGPGTGVGMVAASVAKELELAGYKNEFFTLADLGPSPRLRNNSLTGSKLQLLWDVVRFSIRGTQLAKRKYQNAPNTITFSHNEILYGDIYINHGILKKTLQDRYGSRYFIPKNPLHWFLLLREEYRHGSTLHPRVVSLTNADSETLQKLYPRNHSTHTTIPNGIDLTRFSIASEIQRRDQRESLNFAAEDHVVLFVGHEYERKGLWHCISALTQLDPRFRLVVVGGHPSMIAVAEERVQALGLKGRVSFAGRVQDPRPYFAAADSFVLPSAYETGPLVLLEALASGLPSVMPPVGLATHVLTSGVNGYITAIDADSIATSLEAISELVRDSGRIAVAEACRHSVTDYSWRAVARGYVSLIEDLSAQRSHKA